MSANWTDLLLQFFTFRNPSLLHQAIRAVEGGDNLTIDLMDAAVQFHSVNDQNKDDVLAAFLKSLLGCYSNAAWGSSINPGIQGESLYQHFYGSNHRREASVVALALEDVEIARLESQRKSGNSNAVKNLEATIAGMERAERIAKQLEHGLSIALYLYKRGYALNELTQWKAAKDVFFNALKI